MLTKSRLAALTVFMTAVYFAVLMFLPDSVVGTRRADSILMFSVKITFLAMSAAAATAMALILIFKRRFVRVQLNTLHKYKYFLQLLVKRDFNTRYRMSMLGVVWSMLNPLLTMLVMTMVFSLLFKRQIDNFPVYLLSGLLIFGFFRESTTQGINSVIAGQGVMRKVYVPKYIFPVSKVLSSLVNVVFSFIALFIVVIVTRAPLYWTMLLVPIPILYTFVFALGVTMFLSSLTVFFRDLSYLYGVLLTLLQYLTPIFYPADILPEWAQPFMGFNPLYHYVDYFRALVLRGVVPGLWDNLACMGFALAALCFGTYVFMTKQDKFMLYV